MGKSRKSLGREVFDRAAGEDKSKALKSILEGKQFREAAAAKEVEVTIKLTPPNIKHLDALREALEKDGKGRFSRNELIRIAIMMLTVGDL